MTNKRDRFPLPTGGGQGEGTANATNPQPRDPYHPAEAHHVRCSACRGIGTTGWKRWGDDYEPIPCDVCLGNGRILTFTPKHPREAFLV